MSARPHVAMIVRNPLRVDNRVRKTALSVASFGYRVTVVCPTDGPERFEEDVDGIHVVNVPVSWTLRNQRAIRLARRRVWLMPIGYHGSAASQAALKKLKLDEQEIAAQRGFLGPRGRRARRNWLRVRRRLVVGRVALQKAGSSPRVGLSEGSQEALFRSRRLGAWRRLAPELRDLEFAMGPVVSSLEPDLIHAHDYDMPGIAYLAVGRARAAGRVVRWVYDAHEWVPGLSRYAPERVLAWTHHEEEFAPHADGFVAVSRPIAEGLVERLGLDRTPTVVLNAPLVSQTDPSGPRLRDVVGLPEQVPLVVYSGNLSADRDAETLVRAVCRLDGVHLVFVTNLAPDNAYLRRLLAIAGEAGAADRLHTAPYVEGDRIVPYLSSATVGFCGLSHALNHELTLPNKIFDYLHAGLPSVVADVREMSRIVSAAGMGAVYRSGDVDSLAETLGAVLDDPAPFAGPLHDPDLLSEYSWEHQAEGLRVLYHELLGAPDRYAAQPTRERS